MQRDHAPLMAHLAADVMGPAVGWLARFTGPLLIVMVSGSCGFVLGVAAASGATLPWQRPPPTTGFALVVAYVTANP